MSIDLTKDILLSRIQIFIIYWEIRNIVNNTYFEIYMKRTNINYNLILIIYSEIKSKNECYQKCWNVYILNIKYKSECDPEAA